MGAAYSPGRVNLIGDHTDYSGGLALPMAVDLGTTVELTVTSEGGLGVTTDAPVDGPWTQYVVAIMREMGLAPNATGAVTTTLPVGAGLASSAALEVATALALGFAGDEIELAKLCQRAEAEGSGVPCGLMDQLTCAAAAAGSALLIDFSDDSFETVSLPGDAAVHVLHSGVERQLAGSGYADRRAACESAAALIGPLRSAGLEDTESIADETLRRRARHVISENRRVVEFAEALETGDLPAAGLLMGASHASLRDEFDVSHPALDALVERLDSTAGIHGARLTGAGFGGCVVALADAELPDARIPDAGAGRWRVRPSAGARRL